MQFITFKAWHIKEKRFYKVFAVGYEHIVLLSNKPEIEGANSFKELSGRIKAKYKLNYDFIVSIQAEFVELFMLTDIETSTFAKVEMIF